MKMHIRALLPLLGAGAAGAAFAATSATPTIMTSPSKSAVANYLTLGLSEEHTDNVTRVDSGADSAWITGAVTDFHWSAGNHPRFSAEITGTGGYYHYQNQFYDPEVNGDALGTLAYQVIPGALTLLAQDNFTQSRINELAPVTPDNRQNVNRITAGPELQLHPGGAQNLLLAQALYERADFANSPLDSDTIRGQLSIGRSLDARHALNLTAAVRDVKYAGNQPYPDYQGQDYFLSWVATGIRTTLVADAGYSTTRADGASRVNSPLFRLNIARQISPRSTAFLYAARTQVGAADAIFLDQSLGGRDQSTSGYGITADPFKMDYLGAGYQLDNGRLVLDVRGSVGRERYAQTTLDDRNDQRADVDLTYRFNSMIGAGVFGEYRRETFVNRADAHSDDQYYGAFVGFAFGPRLGLNLSAMRAERRTNLGPNAYDETRVRAILSYTLVGSGQQAPTTMPRFVR
ncbi:MAG: hypothetical protein U1F25_00150 [Rubrivivax sp.]